MNSTPGSAIKTPVLLRLLEALLPADLASEICGDLLEEYVPVRANSRWLAEIFLFRQLLSLPAAVAWRRSLLQRLAPTAELPSPPGGSSMSQLLPDLRYAFRSLTQRPGFTAVVVLTLALGIGANTAVFSIMDGLMLRPFPIPDIDRLVMLFETQPSRGADRDNVSPANFLDWQRESKTLDNLSAFWFGDYNLTGADRPERVVATRVTPGFLTLLGVNPRLGRDLQDFSEDASQQQTVVLNDELWQRRFGARPDIIGETILIDSREFTVVGVGPEGFDYPAGSDMWLPLVFSPAQTANRASHYLTVIGRLADGVPAAEAQKELDVLGARLADEYTQHNEGRGIRVLDLSTAVIDIGMPAFLAVWQATVILILLIACVNIANLMLTRGQDRQKELSLRSALGASRGRIIRQLMTENLILALLGAVAALPLAWIGLEQLRNHLPDHIRRFVVGWEQMTLNPRTLCFTALIAVVTVLIFGLLPSLSSTRLRLSSILSEGSRAGEDQSRTRGRSLMIVAQVAMALTLLIAAILSIDGSIRQITSANGYRTKGIVTMETQLPPQKYSRPEERRQFFADTLGRIRALAGVEYAEAINYIPAGGSSSSRTMVIPGQEALSDSQLPRAQYRVITPDYFRAMEIPLLSGRKFTSHDNAEAAPVAIISQLTAERLWPGEEPVGKTFQFGGTIQQQPRVTVVGVSGDVIHHWFDQGPQPTVYRPQAQSGVAQLSIVVRAGRDSLAVVPAIRRQIAVVDPDQPIFNVLTMDNVVANNTVGLRYMAVMMAVFGAIALVLSVVGIYGLTSYAVSRRTRELGIRAALGADKQSLLRLTVGSVLKLTGIGVALGLIASVAVGQFLAATLFGTVTLNAATYAGVVMLMVAVSLAASLIPALRALRIEPAVALRVE